MQLVAVAASTVHCVLLPRQPLLPQPGVVRPAAAAAAAAAVIVAVAAAVSLLLAAQEADPAPPRRRRDVLAKVGREASAWLGRWGGKRARAIWRSCNPL